MDFSILEFVIPCYQVENEYLGHVKIRGPPNTTIDDKGNTVYQMLTDIFSI